MIYGYARVSTMQQDIDRQITAIKERYPDAVIMKDAFTGKTMNRPEWDALYKSLEKGDVIVFDEVSRMSRDAEEGYETYMKLYDMGVDLIFLKDANVNTESYRKATEYSISEVKSGNGDLDELINGILTYINRFMKAKVREDIRLAFKKAEEELQRRSDRQKGGIEERKKNNKKLKVLYGDDAVNHPEYRQIGRQEGDKLNIKKQEPIKALIRKYSKDFDGTLKDAEVLAILKDKTVKVPVVKRSGKVEEKEISAKLARNTYYKYKADMKQEQAAQ